MTLQGKGFMIWQISRCEGGNAAQIASVAKAAGLTHVLIKIADGPHTYNVNQQTKIDLVPPVASALRAQGIQVWGWHYVYGYNPVGEAQIAIKRTNELNLDGYVIDAEGEYKQPGKAAAATTFMNELRKGIPKKQVALCSYRFPTLHPQLPWKEFLSKCDYNMPQVYWQAAHNAGAQLRRCVREFEAMTPFRPITPTGPVYRNYGWEPTQSEILEFLMTARELNLSAANFFAWDYGRSILIPLWNTIAAFPWSTTPSPLELPARYINALNSRDPAKVATLYNNNAVHITAVQTVQGSQAITTWYNTLLNQTLPSAAFTLTSTSGSGNVRHFTWTATSSKGKVENGNDTIGIINDKIGYHYSFFSVKP